MESGMPGIEEEWTRQQKQLAAQVVQQDASQWHLGDAEHCSLTLVGGLDISFFAEMDADGGGRHSTRRADVRTGCEGSGREEAAHRERRPAPGAEDASHGPEAADANPAPGGSGEWAVAALVVLAFPSLAPVYEDLQLVRLSTPYRPGFLGFRECPAYLELLARAKERGVEPQVLLVDGFGVLHPRRLGSASQLGVTAGVPTVGVAKNLLHVPGAELDEKGVRAAVRAAAEAAAAVAEAGASAAAGQWEGRVAAAEVAAEAAVSGAGRGEAGGAVGVAVEAGARERRQQEAGVEWQRQSEEAGAGRGEREAAEQQQQQQGDEEEAAGTLRAQLGANSAEQQQQQQHPQRDVQDPEQTAQRPRQPVSRPSLPAPLLLRGEGGEVLGAAVLPAGCCKPVYVSVGHLVSLDTAIQLTLRCCRHRVPEPIRLADLKSRERVRQLVAQQAQQAQQAARTAQRGQQAARTVQQAQRAVAGQPPGPPV